MRKKKILEKIKLFLYKSSCIDVIYIHRVEENTLYIDLYMVLFSGSYRCNFREFINKDIQSLCESGFISYKKLCSLGMWSEELIDLLHSEGVYSVKDFEENYNKRLVKRTGGFREATY